METIRLYLILALAIFLLAFKVDISVADTNNDILSDQPIRTTGLTINDPNYNIDQPVTSACNSEKRTITQNRSCPLIPFMAITGKPSKDQIQKYLDDFRAVGIEQFLIYPRSGLELEYMSDEWLDVCQYIIEYAAQNSMSVWLYDEYNWPSGRCGGQVIRKNDEFACKKITVWADFDPMGKKIGNSTIKSNYFWTISSVPLYADLLNREAVESFIELTHEKYFSRFGHYFGSVIKGFFSDEPSPEYAALHHKTNGSLLELPYWKELEAEYHEYTNRDFRFDVEAHLNGATPQGLWKDYFYLLSNRFKATFLDKLNLWCEQHNVLFTGHLMAESNPPQAIWASGNPMKALGSFSIPGMDEIFTRTTTESIEWVTLKMVENAALKTGRGAFAELFALGPCDMPLGKMRQMIWITAMNGVDHYVLAIAPIDSRGNILKPHYYNPYTTTQPWFKALKELGDDAKKAALYALKNADCQIAVRFPQTLTASTIFRTKKDKLHFNLPELLKSLIKWQWSPRLIEEESSDTSMYQAVLIINESGIREEKSGETFTTLNELNVWLGNNIKRSASIESSKGVFQNDILLKTFKDGTICIISLQDKPREQLVLKQPGMKPFQFDLPEYGLFVYEPGKSINKIKSEIRLSPDELLDYELLSSNMIRVDFGEAGKSEFTLSENIDDIRILTRNYLDTVRLVIDGRDIITGQTCHLLPDGLKELYLETDKISLKKGTHTLVLKSKSFDYPYLPSAFISGFFASKQNNLLETVPAVLSIGSFREQGFNNYTGGIRFRKKVTINNEEYLSVNTDGLVAEVFINNQSVGRKAWEPFSWKIPKQFKNKSVDIVILVTNSVGPLFGDYPRKTGEERSWLREFAPK